MNIAFSIKTEFEALLQNHLGIFSWPRVRNDKMRCEHAAMLGPWLCPCSCQLAFQSHPNCQVLKLLFLPFHQISTYLVRLKTAKKQPLASTRVSVSGPTLHWGLGLPTSGVSRARAFFMRSNDCSVDCLVEGLPVLGCLHCQVKVDDVFRSALLFSEILSLDLEPWEGA